MTNGLLSTLQIQDTFSRRHIGPSPAQIAEMLAAIGAQSLQQLMESTVPSSILRRDAMALPAALSEQDALEKLRAIAAQNRVLRSYIGMGYYDTFTPPVILRNVLENPGWYTAYTPYQPEISQGRLEGLLNYQQLVMDLTGMELANASLLDEGTAAAEAMTLCQRMNKKARNENFFIAADCHPQTIAVVRTRAHHLGFTTVVGNPATDLIGKNFFGALLQYPNTYGEVSSPRELIEQAHRQDTLVVVAADLLSLLLLTPPGEMGADVVIGNSQRFGVPMGYGGPHAAFFATRDEYKRSAPGRIIGVSIDRHGNQALRMAMQTREQHIRREKATSNICTAQALLSICAAFYAVYHGPDGLRRIAQRVHRLTQILALGLEKLGGKNLNKSFFDTLTLNVGAEQNAIIARAETAQINLRKIGDDKIGISLDETTTADHVAQLWQVIANKIGDFSVAALDVQLGDSVGFENDVARSSDYLTHPVFNSYHSETEMLRYMKRLENKDIALNQAMIALGSCTMKLNATAEMIPITWPEFNRIHPFAPLDQTRGYQQLFSELEKMLIEATGYAAVSLQPNAGSQGEYAGLLAIKRYHESRQQGHRDIVLIPSSAHGTNPASAALAGLKVVIVECDDNGNVDIADLQLKAEKYRDALCALMATYPSTHGVFEEGIRDICAIVHRHGGQVYVDGANLNALVGVAAPGQFGADVSHINLHKTFCIPHGGGGPGMGPIGVAAHLAPFLPGHPLANRQALATFPANDDVVSAAPWGSASILPISWMYAALMGPDGLTEATQVAILNANYMALRLGAHFPVLYTGRNGRVAHECIIDMRPLKEATGITEEDIAKRLMDFGFHAPTMSFPVPGTLMIEPTESESLEEIDRFCDALIRIRGEIERVKNGDFDPLDNPLKNAPHTAAELIAEQWAHRYSREEAAYPAPELRLRKYWPPVGRIDNVYGDRNLFCACPGTDVFREELNV
jgi:glycine dehydrogenase